jgi:hypothetical protein
LKFHTTKVYHQNPILNYFYIVIYLELGKLFVKTKVKPESPSILLDDLLALGEANQGTVLDDLENELFRLKLVEELSFIQNNGVSRNFTIYKDATASSFQH